MVPKIEDLFAEHKQDFHEDANQLPLLDQEAFEELVADIREHGLRMPVQYYDKKILDGRNRYLACKALGIAEPEYQELSKQEVGDDTLSYVASLNLKRRHLEVHERAKLGVEIKKRLAKLAKERQRQAGKQHGRG